MIGYTKFGRGVGFQPAKLSQIQSLQVPRLRIRQAGSLPHLLFHAVAFGLPLNHLPNGTSSRYLATLRRCLICYHLMAAC
jgi:hypothetical protein